MEGFFLSPLNEITRYEWKDKPSSCLPEFLLLDVLACREALTPVFSTNVSTALKALIARFLSLSILLLASGPWGCEAIVSPHQFPDGPLELSQTGNYRTRLFRDVSPRAASCRGNFLSADLCQSARSKKIKFYPLDY